MDAVEFRGTVEKVSTFSSKGGGLDLRVRTPHDAEVGSVLLGNVQQAATITIEFDEVVEDDEDGQHLLTE